MYFKIRINKINEDNGKSIKETYLTEADNFAEAGYKIVQLIGTNPEVEEVKMMKNIQPSINEQYSDENKLYMIKIAEDIVLDKDKTKTIKYDIPVFANDSNELHNIVNKYLNQGLEDMRLTTISETKWIYV